MEILIQSCSDLSVTKFHLQKHVDLITCDIKEEMQLLQQMEESFLFIEEVEKKIRTTVTTKSDDSKEKLQQLQKVQNENSVLLQQIKELNDQKSQIQIQYETQIKNYQQQKNEMNKQFKDKELNFKQSEERFTQRIENYEEQIKQLKLEITKKDENNKDEDAIQTLNELNKKLQETIQKQKLKMTNLKTLVDKLQKQYQIDQDYFNKEKSRLEDDIKKMVNQSQYDSVHQKQEIQSLTQIRDNFALMVEKKDKKIQFLEEDQSNAKKQFQIRIDNLTKQKDLVTKDLEDLKIQLKNQKQINEQQLFQLSQNKDLEKKISDLKIAESQYQQTLKQIEDQNLLKIEELRLSNKKRLTELEDQEEEHNQQFKQFQKNQDQVIQQLRSELQKTKDQYSYYNDQHVPEYMIQMKQHKKEKDHYRFRVYVFNHGEIHHEDADIINENGVFYLEYQGDRKLKDESKVVLDARQKGHFDIKLKLLNEVDIQKEQKIIITDEKVKIKSKKDKYHIVKYTVKVTKATKEEINLATEQQKKNTIQLKDKIIETDQNSDDSKKQQQIFIENLQKEIKIFKEQKNNNISEEDNKLKDSLKEFEEKEAKYQEKIKKLNSSNMKLLSEDGKSKIKITQFNEQISLLKKNIEDNKIKENQFQSDKQNLENQLNQLRLQITNLESENTNQSNSTSDFIDSRIAKYQLDIKIHLETEIKFQKEIADLNKLVNQQKIIIENLQKEIEILKEQKNNTSNQDLLKKEFEEKEAQYQKKYKEFEETEAQYKEKLKVLNSSYINLLSEDGKSKIKITQFNEQISLITKNIEDYKIKETQFQSDKQNLEIQLNQLRLHIKNLESEKKTFMEQLQTGDSSTDIINKRISKYELDIKLLQEKQINNKKEILDLNNQLDSFRQNTNILNQKITTYEIKCNSQTEEVTKLKQQLQSEIENLNITYLTQIDELKQQINQITQIYAGKINELNIQKNINEENIKQNKGVIEQDETKIEKLQEIIDNHKKEIKQKIKETNDQLKDQENQHKQEILKIKESYQSELKPQEDQNKSDLKSKEDQHKSDLKSKEDQYKLEITKITQQYVIQITQLQTEIKTLKVQITQITINFETERNNKDLQHQQEILEIKESYDLKITQYQSELKSKEDQYKLELAKTHTQTSLQSELLAKEQQYKTELQNITQQYEIKITQINTEIRITISSKDSTIKSLQSDIQVLKDQIKEFSHTYQSEIHLFQTQSTTYQSEINQLHIQLKTYEQATLQQENKYKIMIEEIKIQNSIEIENKYKIIIQQIEGSWERKLEKHNITSQENMTLFKEYKRKQELIFIQQRQEIEDLKHFQVPSSDPEYIVELRKSKKTSGSKLRIYMLAFGNLNEGSKIELENGSFYLYLTGAFKKQENSIFYSRKTGEFNFKLKLFSQYEVKNGEKLTIIDTQIPQIKSLKDRYYLIKLQLAEQEQTESAPSLSDRDKKYHIVKVKTILNKGQHEQIFIKDHFNQQEEAELTEQFLISQGLKQGHQTTNKKQDSSQKEQTSILISSDKVLDQTYTKKNQIKYITQPNIQPQNYQPRMRPALPNQGHQHHNIPQCTIKISQVGHVELKQSRDNTIINPPQHTQFSPNLKQFQQKQSILSPNFTISPPQHHFQESQFTISSPEHHYQEQQIISPRQYTYQNKINFIQPQSQQTHISHVQPQTMIKQGIIWLHPTQQQHPGSSHSQSETLHNYSNSPFLISQDNETKKVYSNGDTYVGEMLNNKKHGFGTMYYHCGNVYVGLWKNDYKEGHGSQTNSNGDKYVGDYYQWKFDQKHGMGLLIYHNGDEFEGEFCYNQRSSKGTFTPAAQINITNM